jgi:hypothetical protein
VSGILRGLAEGTGAATSVEVTANSLGSGLGEFIGSPELNSWTVTGGAITAFDFLAFGIANSAPAVTTATLFFGSAVQDGASFRAGLADSPFAVTTGNNSLSTSDIGLVFEPAIAPIPLPAGGLMLLAGLGGLADLRRLTDPVSRTLPGPRHRPGLPPRATAPRRNSRRGRAAPHSRRIDRSAAEEGADCRQMLGLEQRHRP